MRRPERPRAIAALPEGSTRQRTPAAHAPDLNGPLVFENCGHITFFVTALGEIAGELGASVDFAASPVAPPTPPVLPTMSMVPPIG